MDVGTSTQTYTLGDLLKCSGERNTPSNGENSAPVSPCEPMCRLLRGRIASLSQRGISSRFWANLSKLPVRRKRSRINGWRRNRRSARSLLPAVRAVDGVFNAGDCGAFYGTFWSGWRLSSRKRRCPKGFSGALWLFLEETEVITSLKIGSARRAYFAPL